MPSNYPSKPLSIKKMSIFCKFHFSNIDIDDIDYNNAIATDPSVVAAIALLQGNINPAIVTRDGLRFKCIQGDSTIAACSEAGLEMAYCVIADDINMATVMLQQLR
jgi:hypothetical protein